MQLLKQAFLENTLLKWRNTRSTIVFEKTVVAAFFFFFTMFLFLNSALADEVYLKNGDLLSGEILSTEDDRLIIETNYAKKIEVQFDKVICLTSDKEVTLLLKNSEKLVGRVSCPDLGSLQVVARETGESKKVSLAEVRAINPPPPPPPVMYHTVVNVGGALNEGNTQSKTFNSSAKFQARSSAERHRITLNGKFNWSESEGEVDERNWLAAGKYDFFLTKKFYTYLQTLFEHDAFQDLDLRTTVGPGAGYQFLRTDRVELFGEGGVSYVNEDYESEEDKAYAAGRWSVGLDYIPIPDQLTFYHLHEGFYALTSSEGLYLRSEQGVRLKLVENLSANFQVDWSYKSDPPPETKSSDTALILGLSYEVDF